MRDFHDRMSSRALLRVGGSLVVVAFAYTILSAMLDWPTIAWVPAVLCIVIGAPMLGTEFRRRGIEEDRQTRERRLAERAQTRPPHLD